MNYKEIIKSKINSNIHKNIFFNILKEIKPEKTEQTLSFMFKTYEIFVSNKNIMRNYEIQFENYFKNDYSIKSFEQFNDDVYKKVLEAKTNQYIHRVFSAKYKNLINEETKSLISDIILLSISKKDFQDYFGKKIAIFNSTKELNKGLSDFIEERQDWSQEYLFNKIQKNELIEGTDYDINSNKNNVVIIEIYTYNAMRTLGSNLWCVQRDLETYVEYIEDQELFRIVFDFNKNQSNPYSLNACVYDIDDVLITIFDKKDNEYQMDSVQVKENQLEVLACEIKKIKENNLESFFNKVSKHKLLFEYYFENEKEIDISSTSCILSFVKYFNDFNLKINKDLLIKYNVKGTELIEGDFFILKENNVFKDLFISELCLIRPIHSSIIKKFNMNSNDFISYVEDKVLTEDNFSNSDLILGLIKETYKHTDSDSFTFLFKSHKELVLKHLKMASPEYFSFFYNPLFSNFSCEQPIKKSNKIINDLIGYNLYKELNLSSEKISLIYFETVKTHYHFLFDIKYNSNKFFEKETLQNKKEMRKFFFDFFDIEDDNSLDKIDFCTLFEYIKNKENNNKKNITNKISFENNNHILKTINSFSVFDFNIKYEKSDIINVANLFNHYLFSVKNSLKIFNSVSDEYGYYLFNNNEEKDEDINLIKKLVLSDLSSSFEDINIFFFKHKRPDFLWAIYFYSKFFGVDFIDKLDFFNDIAISNVLYLALSFELNEMEIDCLNEFKKLNREKTIFNSEKINNQLKKYEDFFALTEKTRNLKTNDYSKKFKIERDKMIDFYSLS